MEKSDIRKEIVDLIDQREVMKKLLARDFKTPEDKRKVEKSYDMLEGRIRELQIIMAKYYDRNIDWYWIYNNS